ncbi:hypothetical protein Nmel_011491 [Mimus melanotis]
MKLMYCPHCRGMSSVKPCNNYCLNVVKGCLANQADLSTEWKYLMDSLIGVADRIDGPYNVDTVIGTIHMRIAEAISNLQENKDSITSKVFQGCGNPKISTKGSSSEDKKRRGKVTLEAKSSAQVLEMLVGLSLELVLVLQVLDAKGNLTALKTYWITLPSSLCSKKVMSSSASDDKCWNGMTKGSYLPEVMGDGLANQINNPEVEVDITKPDMTIRQQIMQLKIMTNRLGNANNGNDVDFQDTNALVSLQMHWCPCSCTGVPADALVSLQMLLLGPGAGRGCASLAFGLGLLRRCLSAANLWGGQRLCLTETYRNVSSPR